MNLFGLDRAELENIALACGEPRYRGRQLFHGIYGLRREITELLTDLSKQFRRQLAERFHIALPSVREKFPSRDGAARYLLDLADGQPVESVFMPEHNRTTLCISSQAGCAVDCRFCFTALMGLKRNLTAGEIAGQVYAILRDQVLRPGARLNVVFMGMGEPLLNFEQAMKSVRLLADQDGLAIPVRRMTLSTSGVIPRIRDLGSEPVRPKLAISLNASENEQRTALMPLNQKYPLDDLMEACRAYPLRPRERLTFEYVLLDGVNDSEEDAQRVAGLLGGMRAKVNLIPYNSGSGLPFRPPNFGRVLAFREVLAQREIDAFIRISRGQDVRAACGQLMLEDPREKAG
ncbi:MAG: 23S rRNA (adenine(2503)-C(2))-methyltransferase RlmN [Terriglobia bacterium]